MAFNKGEWKPNPKQELFLRIPWTIREGLYGGGNGSGKSDVLLVYPLAHELHLNPRFKQVFQRRTYPELKNEIVPRSRELYRSFGAKFNRTDMCWTFPRPDQMGSGMQPAGALIFLAHCENEKDVHNFDSMEINLYTPDELTSFTQFIYEYIALTRVRTSDPNLPAIIRAAGMPGNIGHNFVKKRFIDPYKKGSRVIKDKVGNKRIYIHSTVIDNPHIDPNYAQSLKGISNEAEKKARLLGDWDAYLGTVFDEFRTQHFPDEPSHAIHRIDSFNIPDWWPKVVVIDWGFAAMNYVSYSAISPKGRVYTYREQSWLKTKISEWAPFVKEIVDKEQPRIIKVCKSAGQDRGQDKTIQQQISESLGWPVALSDNSPGSRVAGKQLMHEYLRWQPKYAPVGETPIYNHEYALWIYRNRGEREFNSYLRTFEQAEPETNLPKWQIFCCDADEHEGHEFCCPKLISSIQACSYDKPKNDKPAEDVAEFNGDDPYDNARYMLDTVEAYFEDAKNEWILIQKRAQLTEQLSVDGDMTAFYRNARVAESNERAVAVRRYHH